MFGVWRVFKHACDCRDKDNRMRIAWCGLILCGVLDMIIRDTNMVGLLVFYCYWRNCYKNNMIKANSKRKYLIWVRVSGGLDSMTRW